jgi:hypothetical protein
VAYPESSRDQLPRTERYPLGRRVVDAALSDAGVESLDIVYILRAGITDWKLGNAVVMCVDYRAQTRDSGERVELRVHAVPTHCKSEVESNLLAVLPRFAEWIRRAELAELPWRSSDHALVARWCDDTVIIEER